MTRRRARNREVVEPQQRRTRAATSSVEAPDSSKPAGSELQQAATGVDGQKQPARGSSNSTARSARTAASRAGTEPQQRGGEEGQRHLQGG